MPHTEHAARHLDGLRDARYGEILLITPDEDGHLKGAVYNTLGLNDCPPEQWNALDPPALAEQFQVPLVFLNGPRFWVVDEITAFKVGEVTEFDGLAARLVAEVRIPPEQLDPTGTTPKRHYVDTTVERDTEYVLSADRPAFALVAPGDRTYVMQTYAHLVDDSLTLDSLSTLGEQLSLPRGWEYRPFTPEDDLVVRTVGGEAHVVQDDLQNTYMLLAR
ncbi:hypothetical protein [Streptomyces sp. NPDC002133]|uniref:hypothetical protein n=1 Tax=Streptomyces sp. NPDC002133 TaxID=3154409 RepID=UPI00332B0257